MTWFDSLDLSKVSDEDRFRVLEYAVSKHGRARVQEALRVSRITMWRLLNRQARVDDDKLRALLSLITQREFENLVSARDRLRALGVLREDGTVDYGLALEVLAVARSDEYLKNAILRFVVREFREDLKRMLGVSFAGVVFRWDKGVRGVLKGAQEEEECDGC